MRRNHVITTRYGALGMVCGTCGVPVVVTAFRRRNGEVVCFYRHYRVKP